MTSSLSRPRLVWVYPDDLVNSLHITPRLEITRALQQAGWEVNLLAAGPDGVHSLQGVDVIGFRWPEVYLLGPVIFHWSVLKYILRSWGKIDFVMFPFLSLPWMLLLQMLRPFLRGRKPLFVMDTRTLVMELEERKTLRLRIRSAYLQFSTWLANQFVDGQTAITPRMAESLHISEKKLWGIWPSGVALERFFPAQAGRRWPQGDEPVQLVYLGVFSFERNLMALCQAVEKANQEGLCFSLSLIGDGPERKALEDFAGQTEGRVQVTGPFPHTDVPTILAQMHIGALPFPDEQQFRVSSPIKLFEYMGAGLPILATRISCHTDVIGNQPCAFWAEDSSVEGITDALRKAWKQRDNLATMGCCSVEAAQEYTWEASAKKLITALQYGQAKKGANR